MDATKRPFRIPPEFSTYAEKHGVFEMFKEMMQQLLVQKPDTPITFLIDYLSLETTDLPSVIIIGPPASGKCTIARLISSKIRAIHLCTDTIISEVSDTLKEKAACYKNHSQIPKSLWVEIIKERMKMFDVARRGYLFSGFPATRDQALAVQAAGISPKHCILLDAPDTVLIERAAGKRIDPFTGDVYHTTFDWPTNPDVHSRLVQLPDYSENNIKKSLELYHRNIPGVIECYKSVLKTVNADQPKPDIFAQAYVYVSGKARSVAPFTPRILLLGAAGSGRAVQASLLTNKYDIVNVSCGQLVKEAMVNESKYGKSIKSYIDQGMNPPDNIVLELLKDRLSRHDCLIHGWVLHGFPMNTDQAAQLRATGYEPNRVFLLEVPNDSIVERLMLRMTDPVTGDRYHLLYNPPRVAEVRDRLVRHPRDEENEVRRRLKQNLAYKDELEDFYPQAQHINGDQDPHTVFETIESMTVNRLPKHYDA